MDIIFSTQLIDDAAEGGLISRQEAVSMLPPLFLNISPGNTVLDLCCAPGSKTGQLLELSARTKRVVGPVSRAAFGEEEEEEDLPDGAVVANDVDGERLQVRSRVELSMKSRENGY